jgi:flavin-dependent dehydrogenase
MRYDVVIGGGGLAGLSLARQLSLSMPELSVAVVDPLVRPLPEAAFKVGESSVEVGARYFGEVLQLAPYLMQRHYRKFGLRYFMGDSSLPFHLRPEWGTNRPLPVPSYQLDRGVLENDLRGMVEDAGVTLYEGHHLSDVVLDQGSGDHAVDIVRRADGAAARLTCRFFVDATGRRRLLQTKLGLSRESPHKASAAWFRMEGRLDIDEMVPRAEREWHERVPDRMRYFSTNHLLGKGYWFWFIPLGSGNTSLGIVTDENIHPVRTYSTVEKAFQWLDRYEPRAAEYLRNRPLMDFKVLRNFSYLSRQVFSHHRWACVGEAGVFLDPFYSPGSDTIAIGNTIAQELIALDRDGKLTPGVTRTFDRFFRAFIDTFLETYTNRYATFGRQQVASEKFLWDTCLYWAWTGQFVFRDLLKRPELLPQLLGHGLKFSLLHKRVQDLLCDWAGAVEDRSDYRFLAPYDIPYFRHLHEDLAADKPLQSVLDDFSANLERFEEWAIALFYRAVADVHPGKLRDLPDPPWVNAWAIGLDPSKWEGDRLFTPPTLRRSLEPIRAMLTPGMLAPGNVLQAFAAS